MPPSRTRTSVLSQPRPDGVPPLALFMHSAPVYPAWLPGGWPDSGEPCFEDAIASFDPASDPPPSESRARPPLPSGALNSILPFDVLRIVFHHLRDAEISLITSATDQPARRAPYSLLVISHTCSFWRTVAAGEPRLWSTIGTEYSAPIISKMLLHAANAPVTLLGRRNAPMRPQAAAALAPHCASLRRVDLFLEAKTSTQLDATHPFLQDLWSRADHLDTVSIALDPQGQFTGTFEAGATFIVHAPQLRRLHLSGFSLYFFRTAMQGVSQRLTSLVIERMTHLLNEVLAIIQTSCPHLRVLAIGLLTRRNVDRRIGAFRLPELQSLTLSGHPHDVMVAYQKVVLSPECRVVLVCEYLWRPWDFLSESLRSLFAMGPAKGNDQTGEVSRAHIFLSEEYTHVVTHASFARAADLVSRHDALLDLDLVHFRCPAEAPIQLSFRLKHYDARQAQRKALKAIWDFLPRSSLTTLSLETSTASRADFPWRSILRDTPELGTLRTNAGLACFEESGGLLHILMGDKDGQLLVPRLQTLVLGDDLPDSPQLRTAQSLIGLLQSDRRSRGLPLGRLLVSLGMRHLYTSPADDHSEGLVAHTGVWDGR